MKNIVMVLTVFLLSTTATFAESVCNANLSNEDLMGEYKISIGPGILTVITRKGDRRVHDAPLMEEGTATIALYDGVPILYSDDFILGGQLEIALRPAANDEKDLGFLDDPTIPTAGSEDMALVLDCDNATDMPQLIGAGTLTGNGVTVPVSVQLLVYFQDDGGVSAIGVYDSTVISEAASGKIEFHLRFSIFSS